MGIDKMGIDEMGIDEIGLPVDKMGLNWFFVNFKLCNRGNKTEQPK